jgi:methionine-rich copper-binding protein CopC
MALGIAPATAIITTLMASKAIRIRGAVCRSGLDSGANAPREERKTIMSKVGLFSTIAVLAFAATANAHPQLKAAGPAPGSVVTASPKALRIQFNEGITLAFSGVDLINEKGQKVMTGAASTAAKDKAQLIVPLKSKLTPGKYTVAWHAVGDDTHRVQGKYQFSVK